jgi:hypothetical protein
METGKRSRRGSGWRFHSTMTAGTTVIKTNGSRKMKVTGKMPVMFSARLWPGDIARVNRVRVFLEKLGDGSPVSFADVVRWLLAQSEVKINNRENTTA